MAFHEVRFPTDISLGATGGPERRTEIVTLASGAEARNALWADSRRRYDAGYGIRGPDDLHAVIAFFEARNGRLHGFRWKDWTDYRSAGPASPVTDADQLLGFGDGRTAQFPLVKLYRSGAESYQRRIVKPVAGTVRISVEGAARQVGVHVTVSTESGLVTFLPGQIPGAGQAIRAGFEFDVPVRFDDDHLAISLAHSRAGEITSIPIREIRL